MTSCNHQMNSLHLLIQEFYIFTIIFDYFRLTFFRCPQTLKIYVHLIYFSDEFYIPCFIMKFIQCFSGGLQFFF